MCGIFTILNNNNILDNEFIKQQFNKAQHRGPDNSTINLSNNIYVGFHRLQINGLNNDSNQPFIIDNIMLICNGEIYNHKKLFENIKFKPTTNSDCEIIIYLYKLYGIEYTLNLLDGVFAFILFDYNINKIYIARDPYGVRPLYYLCNTNYIMNINKNNDDYNNLIGFASELKQLTEISNKFNDYSKEDELILIKQFTPGEYMELVYQDKWFLNNKIKYNSFKLNNLKIENQLDVLENIHNFFYNAVKKRVENTDRPVACLLSGGLDSSIVAALVNKIYDKQLETYSIGLEGSEDLKYARIVAEFLDTKHTEIIVSEDDFFNQIPEVITMIESYDTTTVRASVGNYLVAKYISENSDAKVIFNGDGSDELMGGYLYFKKCPDHFEFDKECKRLLENICYFDVLRSDRSISTNGLEPRTPFLDRNFVDYYLSISSKLRYDSNLKQEKFLFRKAFDKGYLPDEILWRKKEAFSDGVSKKTRSWHEIIKEKVVNQKDIKYDINIQYNFNSPQSLEQLYYRTIFELVYPNFGYIIPYFWMPKYIKSNDASARTLELYNEG
jgi:asparagine synthase (glutamine-hydrolysing)